MATLKELRKRVSELRRDEHFENQVAFYTGDYGNALAVKAKREEAELELDGHLKYNAWVKRVNAERKAEEVCDHCGKAFTPAHATAHRHTDNNGRVSFICPACTNTICDKCKWHGTPGAPEVTQ